jgi:D-3-phosphoglycerate dehydrogenase
LLGASIQGKTLGIIGTGAVGTTLTEMVYGLKMKVIGYDILPNKKFINYGGQYMERDEVFRKADFVSIHIPLNKQTFHSIGIKEFELMKKTAFLINASRGAIVNEKALYQSIRTNKIAGAAVDVFETEPPSDSLLTKLDNVITTPHIAAFTYETFRRMDKESVAKLSKVFEN